MSDKPENPDLPDFPDINMEEIIKHLAENIDSDYFNPKPEWMNKFVVHSNFDALAVFDTKAEALDFCRTCVEENITIRRHYLDNDGELQAGTIVPGAVRYAPDGPTSDG